MTHTDLTELDDRRLQADPILDLSGGRASRGLVVASIIAALVIIATTMYALVYY